MLSFKFLRLALTVLLVGTPLTQAWAAQKILYFGIVPQQAASRLAQMWVPFIEELSRQSGLSIKFATMKDIPAFEECLAQGAYDIAYMNPYHYTVFSQQSGYRAIAHQADKKLNGLIVVQRDAPFQTLPDLNNQKIAFPSPAAFGASVLPRAEMKLQGLNVTPVYVKSHDSVYKSVVSGLFAAGGGVERTFVSAPDELRKQLRVIYRTASYTPHAFAVSSNIEEADIEKIKQALLALSVNKSELTQKIGMTGIVAADDVHWNDVRKLSLTQEQTEVAKQGILKCRLD